MVVAVIVVWRSVLRWRGRLHHFDHLSCGEHCRRGHVVEPLRMGRAENHHATRLERRRLRLRGVRAHGVRVAEISIVTASQLVEPTGRGAI